MHEEVQEDPHSGLAALNYYENDRTCKDFHVNRIYVYIYTHKHTYTHTYRIVVPAKIALSTCKDFHANRMYIYIYIYIYTSAIACTHAHTFTFSM